MRNLWPVSVQGGWQSRVAKEGKQNMGEQARRQRGLLGKGFEGWKWVRFV